MTTGYVHPQLHAEIVARLKSEYDQLLADLRTQCAFWRRAAKDAVEGWCALEDKVDSAVCELQPAYDEAWPTDAAHGAIAAALAVLVEVDPLEPPAAELEAVLRELPEVDLGDGHKLRVVEEETPIKKV